MAQRSNVFTKAQVMYLSASSTATAVDFENGSVMFLASVKSCRTESRTFDMLDDTVMGETARSRKAGLEDVTATIEFVQTFEAGGNQLNIDEILSNLATISQSGE